jgi:hypothetical protein
MENHCQTIAGLIEDDYQFIAAVSTGALIGLVVWMMLHVTDMYVKSRKAHFLVIAGSVIIGVLICLIIAFV